MSQLIGRNVIVMVTQRIPQISECELDAGIQKYQVEKFQIIAESKSDITTIIPKVVDWFPIASSGSIWIIAIATQIHPNITHRKFINPARSTAFFALSDLVYITGATAFAVSWNPFINSNIQTKERQATVNKNIQISIQKSIFFLNIFYNMIYCIICFKY